MDALNTKCKQCGILEEFVFDIFSFYNPFQNFEELDEVKGLLKRVYPESEVWMKTASLMETTLMYIKQLKESGDIMAFEYIADAVQWAMGKKLDEQTAKSLKRTAYSRR